MKIAIATLHVRRSAQAVPLAAGCLAAALPEPLRSGTVLIDLFPDQSDEELLATLCVANPDLVAFPTYVWNRQRVVALAQALKQRTPEIVLVAGGPEVTGDPAGMAAAAPWTALICGEGERAFAALVGALADGRRTDFAGLLWSDDGLPAHMPPARGMDLLSAPSPWLQGLLQPTVEGGVLWEVARGCAFACDYCFDARGQDGVRPLNFDRLEAELEWFDSRNVSQVWVLDSTFNYPPERGKALLELLLAKAPHLHYHLEAKADYLDRETIRLLGQLNGSLQIGLQTVNPEALKTIHRPLDLDRLVEQVHLLTLEGITFGFDLIYGLPGDDFHHFQQSLDQAIGFAPNHLHIFPLAVLPGTRLAQQAGRYGLESQDDPPYEILASDSWSAADLSRSRRLATAVDLFYNTGRAVAFFPALLQVLDLGPCQLFDLFMDWLMAQPGLAEQGPEDLTNCSASDIYLWQQQFLTTLLKERSQDHLVTAVLDLLCYHYHYAETLLGAELPLPDGGPDIENCWERAWQRAEQVRLVPFAYEIVDLMEMEGTDLVAFNELFRPTGSVALFCRRHNEVFCESLEENFLRLLQLSDGQRSPREIFAGTLPRSMGEELVSFAVLEGLLTPA